MTATNEVAMDIGITKDSEEVFEMYCESCNREGTVVTAIAFCPTCADHLCTTCLKYHRRFLPDHEYVDSDKMSRDICLEKCSVHKKEIIKFFCQSCKTFACSICKKNDHTSLESCDIKYLPDLVKNPDTELKKLILKSDQFHRRVTDIKQNRQRKYENIDRIPNEAKVMLKKETEAMLTLFLKEVQNIEEKIQLENKLENAPVEDLVNKYNSSKLDIDKLSDSVKRSPNSDKYKIFMRISSLSQEIESAASSLEDKAKNSTRGGDTFKSGIKMQVDELTERVKAIGTEVQKFGTKSNGKREKLKRKVATEVTTLSVKVNSDECDSCISKCFLLSNRFLFICDTNNYSVKLFGTRNRKLLCVTPVNSSPHAATKVTDTEVAIVQDQEYYRKGSVIKFLTLTKAKLLFFQKKRSFQTEMKCLDLVYNDGRLIISMQGRGKLSKVQILDMDGYVLKDIESDQDDYRLFTQPDFLAVYPDGDNLYVSDRCTGNITEVNLINTEMVRSIRNFWNPLGITLNNEGHIFVVDSGRCQIQVLHPDGREPQTLLENAPPPWRPQSLYYCSTENKLYIGTNGNCVKVFKITEEEFEKCEVLEKVEKWMPSS